MCTAVQFLTSLSNVMLHDIDSIKPLTAMDYNTLHEHNILERSGTTLANRLKHIPDVSVQSRTFISRINTYN